MRQTSIEAYEAVKEQLPRLHRIILSALRKINSGSFRDIAKAAGLRDDQVWKRLSELETEGRIQTKSDKICPITGRRVSVWTIKQN